MKILTLGLFLLLALSVVTITPAVFADDDEWDDDDDKREYDQRRSGEMQREHENDDDDEEGLAPDGGIRCNPLWNHCSNCGLCSIHRIQNLQDQKTKTSIEVIR